MFGIIRAIFRQKIMCVRERISEKSSEIILFYVGYLYVTIIETFNLKTVLYLVVCNISQVPKSQGNFEKK